MSTSTNTISTTTLKPPAPSGLAITGIIIGILVDLFLIKKLY